MALKGQELDSAIGTLQLAQIGSPFADGSFTGAYGLEAIGLGAEPPTPTANGPETPSPM